jgi:hypothetical protein
MIDRIKDKNASEDERIEALAEWMNGVSISRAEDAWNLRAELVDIHYEASKAGLKWLKIELSYAMDILQDTAIEIEYERGGA